MSAVTERASQSVLLVDTDLSQLEHGRRLLESAGFRVRSASSFDDATRLLTMEAPDVIVTDVKLGPYNGLHLVLRGRIAHAALSAIITSDSDDVVLHAEAERQNAAFLVRPIDDGRFLAAINQLHANHLRAAQAC